MKMKIKIKINALFLCLLCCGLISCVSSLNEAYTTSTTSEPLSDGWGRGQDPWMLAVEKEQRKLWGTNKKMSANRN